MAWKSALLLAACMGGAQAASISPAYMAVAPGRTVQFTGPPGAVFEVNNVVGGTAASGTVTPGGLYTAPASLPSPAAVTVSAVSAGNPLGIGATATLTLLAGAPTGTTYYVAPDGQDTNPGTRDAPFRTLGHAAGVAGPGDTVLARAGVYGELLTPRRSGTPDAGPITFAAYPGETPVIDGTGLGIPNGQNGLVTLNDISLFVLQGFELRNYTTTSRRQVPVGIYVTGAGDGVQLVGNHIHDIATRAHTTPRQCGSNALGIAVYGSRAPQAVTNLVVSGNELDHLVTGCSESMSIDGNVDGYAVTSNEVHDNDNIGIDSIGYERVSPDPAYDRARHGEVRGNLVHDITSYGNPDYGRQYASDGIYVDGGADITIEQNIVYHTDLAIELASEHGGRLTSRVVARNNLLYLNNSNGISIGGYGPPRGGTDHCTIVNNTLYENDTKNTGSGEFQIQYHATDNLFANNIVVPGKQGLVVHNYTQNTTAPATLDHDLYGVAANGGFFVWNGTRYKSFAAYQAASSEDAATITGDPGFRDPSSGDFRLDANSPALDAGHDYGAVLGRADLAGQRRVVGGRVSIGAYQK